MATKNFLFQSTTSVNPKRNTFNLSHETKLSCNMGDLVPVLLEPVIPGDKMRVNVQALLRLAPMLAPLMHRVNVTFHYFFVPHRLVWSQWEDFITGSTVSKVNSSTGVVETPIVFPTFTIPYNYEQTSGVFVTNTYFKQFTDAGTLGDYLGLPTPKDYVNLPQDGSIKFSQLPFRSYGLIYNEYYRDENLQDEIPIALDGGDMEVVPGKITTYTSSIFSLRKRAWEKDYFTSALPWPQQNGVDVLLPLGTTAPVKFTPFVGSGSDSGVKLRVYDSNGSEVLDPSNVFIYNSAPNTIGLYQPLEFERRGDGKYNVLSPDGHGSNAGYVQYDPGDTLSADLSAATAITINDLRRANAVQRWLEINGRCGDRYIEFSLGQYGVKTSDARIQRPEYLGGMKMPVVVSEVVQTSATDRESPQGNLAGYGVSTGSNKGFTRYFEEFGYVIGIMSVTPRTAYFQGLSSHWTKYDFLDYAFPVFAHLGEQPIKNQELYYDYAANDQSINLGTFGYTPRYAEYKFHNDEVHGEFRTNLRFWHMARYFKSRPLLNGSFVECHPSVDPFAVQYVSDDPSDPDSPKTEVSTQCYVQIYQSIYVLRKLPKFGLPRL